MPRLVPEGFMIRDKTKGAEGKQRVSEFDPGLSELQVTKIKIVFAFFCEKALS